MSVVQDIKTIWGKKKLTEKDLLIHETKKTILIIEDDKILLEMYQDKFTNEGFEVIIAENGKQGLEKVISQKPDVILLDLMMPIMDGKTMLRKVREFPQFKRLPVIVLTNAGAIENIRETKRYDNACEFLIKSNVSLEEIVDRVKFWMNAFP